MEEDVSKINEALTSGMLDERRPIDSVRQAFFQQTLDGFDPKEHPEEIPQIFREAECNVFGMYARYSSPLSR
jgi:hypothetical protein